MGNVIQTAARQLRDLAGRLDEMQLELSVPPEETNVISACTFLRTLLGDSTYFSVQMSINCHSHRDKPAVEWTVYDGFDHLKAGTLKAALAIVAAKHSSSQESDIEEAQKALTPATV